MTPLDQKMPAKLIRLPELAYNLWWSWRSEARDLFKSLDLSLWRSTSHNPVQMLQEIEPAALEQAAADSLFIRQYNKVLMVFDKELGNGNTWLRQTFPEHSGRTIAYFSAEFGIHNSLPIYSGGLGILAGDHAKAASDLGIQLVGVGFMYPQGYFRQRIPSHGWQEAVYEQLDLSQAPIRPMTGDDGEEIRVLIEIGDREVAVRVWQVLVGRTKLFLMDTDVNENDPWDRELTARLYSGDSDLRLRQEILLGTGGVRVLDALGVEPAVWHLNEGHSAFLLLECIRKQIHTGKDFASAAEYVKARSIFTTHTPVAAGHDAFAFHSMEQYFAGYWAECGITREEFMNLGRNEESWGTAFNMTVLALQLAGQANGVSELHGTVSRDMWGHVRGNDPAGTGAIKHVTNGVHVSTWLASEISDLYDQYLGNGWRDNLDDPAIWERINDIPDATLWEVHSVLKRKSMRYFREKVRRQWLKGQSDPTRIMTGGTLLDPDTLTIGFARRFPTYKRATLIFRDLDRLLTIMLDRQRPVQLVFAGKAHPADDPGKAIIQQIYNLSKHHMTAGRIAFIEDYDMHMARYLVQGVDVWLNTPIRSREASGTSGQKAALNGVPNLSVLDGWWAEGYNGANGWAIGDPDGSAISDDAVDVESLYSALESEIVPLYYDRDLDKVPRGWVRLMRESMRTCTPVYSSRRMLKDYLKLYRTALMA